MSMSHVMGVELQVATPSSVRHSTVSYRLLVLLTKILVAHSVCVVCVRDHSIGFVIERFEVQFHFSVVVYLSKKLYSHCSSLPSCIMETWWPAVN